MPSRGGSVELPFTISSTGHLLVVATVNGVSPAWFIVDTASGGDVINAAKLTAFNLTKGAAGKGVDGLTSSAAMHALAPFPFAVGDLRVQAANFIAIDLTYVETALGSHPLAGLIGAPFLIRHRAVIDYRRKRIAVQRRPIRVKVIQRSASC